MIINTTAKTIQIESENLGEIIEQLQKMLPETWKEYKLISPVKQFRGVRSVRPRQESTPDIPIFREIPYTPYTPSTGITCGEGTCDGFTLTYGDPSKFGTLNVNDIADFLFPSKSKS
jgi:hypothetical protein